MMMRFILPTMIGLAVALTVQSFRLSYAQAKLETIEIQLAGCNARAVNLEEDKQSDDAVDNIPDADLSDVPDHWLLPPGSRGE
jgi:hypothetical protein